MSFLRDYLAFSSNNEAPEMFHVWAGYVALSASVARRVWLPFGPRALYPNIYVMYVGGAGNGKTSAMFHTKKILSALGNVPISCSIETPEGLLRFMNGNPNADPPVPSPVMFLTTWPDGIQRQCHPMTIIASEYIDFISKNPEGWTHMLNNIWDEDKYSYRTKNSGEDHLIGPYMVLIGALTTDVAADLHKQKIISTGLARRTIFQYGERRWDDPHAIPEDTDFHKAKYLDALNHLKKVQRLTGAFTWSDEVKAWWRKWYNAHNVEVPRKSPLMQGWFASKPDQVLKLAMLTALSESTELKLEIAHLQIALDYLTVLEEDLPKVFGGTGRNENAGVTMKIQEFIINCPKPVSFNNLRTNFWSAFKDPRDLPECLRHLVDTKQVVKMMLTVGMRSEEVYASQEVAKTFAAALQREQHAATQTALRQGSSVSTDPSTKPAALPSPGTHATLTVLQPADEIVASLPRTVESDQSET